MPTSVSVGIPYVMTGDFIGNNDIDFENAKRISEEDYEQLAKKIKPEKGDILFARYASVGTVRYVETNQKFLISYSCAILKPNEDIEGKYLYFYIQTGSTQQRIELEINTGSQRNIGIDSLKNNIAVLVPKIDEQSKIGTFFKQLDDTIALHQRKLTLLKQLKQTYLDALFPQNDEHIPVLRFFDFADSWEEHRFSDIVNRVSVQSSDFNLPKVEFEDIISGEGRLNKDIAQKFDSRKGTVFEPKYILYGKLRPYLKNWLFPNFKGIALGDFWVFEPKNSSALFDYYLIQSDRYQTAANLSSGTKMPRSDWKIVSETVFNIPNCIEELEKIGAFFKQLDNAIALHQYKLEKLIELKNVLLGKMFL